MAEKKDKKKQGRRAYLNDFKVGAGGEYVYTGAVYRFTSRNRKGFVLKLALLTALSLICGITQGCISAAGMDDCFYVIIPWIAELGFSVAAAWAAGRIIYSGELIRKYVYEATFGKLPIFCNTAAAFAAVGIICEAVYIILEGFDGKLVFTIIFIALKALSGVSALLLKKLAADAPIEK